MNCFLCKTNQDLAMNGMLWYCVECLMKDADGCDQCGSKKQVIARIINDEMRGYWCMPCIKKDWEDEKTRPFPKRIPK